MEAPLWQLILQYISLDHYHNFLQCIFILGTHQSRFPMEHYKSKPSLMEAPFLQLSLQYCSIGHCRHLFHHESLVRDQHYFTNSLLLNFCFLSPMFTLNFFLSLLLFIASTSIILKYLVV